MHCSVVVLVHLYLCLQNDSGRGLKWGGEVEYIIVKLDHKQKKARVSLRAATLLDLLTRLEEDMKRRAEESEGEPAEVKLPSLWRPEYTSYMVQLTFQVRPHRHYSGDT